MGARRTDRLCNVRGRVRSGRRLDFRTVPNPRKRLRARARAIYSVNVAHTNGAGRYRAT